MNKRVIKIGWVILIITVTITIAIYGLWSRNALKRNHRLTIAQIYRSQNGSRGSAGGFSLDYSITVNGKKYNTSSRYLNDELSFFKAEKYIVGKSFPAVYYPLNPSISSLLITPNDFIRFGYSLPDSLHWVLECLPH